MDTDFDERKISGLIIKIDKATCIGTGNCIKVAPDIFEFDNEKITSFLKTSEEIEKERLLEACTVCPVNALYAIDENGNQVVP